MKEDNKKSEIALREEEILKFWQDNKIFEKSLKKDSPKGEFVFYDGPPFATGLPHYGHILAGTIKDAIPRYKTMKGYHVRRQWGWDCHGLPLENEIEKELGFKSKKDIEEFGIDKFNEKARSFVLRYASDWEKIIPRLGRWVDMGNPYKTMDASYTETVLWIFKTLFDKGLVYEGFKSMHLCPRCGTTLSNFEVNQGYKDITDIAITVKFELEDEPGTYLLAWTTTPWTLPGNVALAVGEDIEYVKIKKENENIFFILAKERLEKTFSDSTYETVETFKGKKLIGKKYKPLFDYYINDEKLKNKENGWKIYGADFVTTEDGTGIVHIAPAFGEDDLRLGQENNLPLIAHVGKDGKMNSEVSHFAGMVVKPKSDDEKERLSTDIEVIKYLQENNLFFSKEKITHSYPHCWRCDTPLLNYATSSWFVKVGELKEKLVEKNKKINWVPKEIGDGRFGKWLEGARDWAISRSRYWGAPIPVWKCSECDKLEILGSILDIKKRTKSSNKYFVMRHGQAENNEKNIINSDEKIIYNLTEKGRNEVLEVAKKLHSKKISRLYVSPFERTRESAEILMKELGLRDETLVIDERLRELDFGDFDGKQFPEFLEYEEKNIKSYADKIPGGESYADVKNRFGEFLYEVDTKHKNENILIVSHGIASEVLLPVVEGADKKRSKEIIDSFEPKTGEILEMDFSPLPHNDDYEIDFHRPYIDRVEFNCDCGGIYRRVPEVFDCWFESGAMPYGQFHHPFNNLSDFNPKEKVGFPADFIAEGLDQTRGWFYTLLILGVALFDESPYKNVLVNGLVLAEDGQKMSKRLKNYPDPVDLVGKYGADALRMYLLSSPVVRAEDLNFSENGVSEVLKKNIFRLSNVLSFYEMYSMSAPEEFSKTGNVLDKWIIARFKEVSKEISKYFEKYELDRAVRAIPLFIDDLSTWYLRRSRDRLRGKDVEALSTLRNVLYEFSKTLAPIMPFLAEDIYRRVGAKKTLESVHLESWQEAGDLNTEEKEILELMQEARNISSLGLESRSRSNIKVRQPLKELKVRSEKLQGKGEYLELVREEVNVKEIYFDSKIEKEVVLDETITPELKEEGDLRDLLRSLQDMRKERGLAPSDKAILSVGEKEASFELVKKYEDIIKKDVGLSEVRFGGEGFEIEI